MIVVPGRARQTGLPLTVFVDICLDTPGRLRGCVRPSCDRRGMTTSGPLRWCAICGAEQPFEQPECADGHGSDCPEWVCSACGDALLVSFEPAAAVSSVA